METHPRALVATNISPDTCNYGKLVNDPFKDAHHCSMTSAPAFPSGKRTAFIKGVIATANTSNGFVYAAFNPWRGCNSTSSAVLAKNFSLFVSNSSFPGSSVNITASTTGVDEYNTNALDANTNSTVERFRVTAAGLRWRFIGTERFEGGRQVGMALPMHRSAEGLSVPDLTGYAGTHTSPINRNRWYGVRWTPQHPNETDYVGYSSVVPAQYPWQGNYPLVLMAQSPQETGGIVPLRMEVEAFVHYERVGFEVPDRTPSVADPVGFNAVMGVMQNENSGTATIKSQESFYSSLARYIDHHTSGIRTVWSSLPQSVQRTAIAAAGHAATRALTRHRQAFQVEYAIRDRAMGTEGSLDVVSSENRQYPRIEPKVEEYESDSEENSGGASDSNESDYADEAAPAQTVHSELKKRVPTHESMFKRTQRDIEQAQEKVRKAQADAARWKGVTNTADAFTARSDLKKAAQDLRKAQLDQMYRFGGPGQ